MSEPLTSLIGQVEELCGLHDHITRVIARLAIPQAAFSDRYPQSNKATFEFESIVQLFLYQYARGFTQSELYRRLKGAAYVWIRFDLPRPPTQQAFSWHDTPNSISICVSKSHLQNSILRSRGRT